MLDRLENDVDQGAPFMAATGGVGEILAAFAALLHHALFANGDGARVGARRLLFLRALAPGAGCAARRLVLRRPGTGQTRVEAGLARGLLQEHRHQHLHQHQQGVDKGDALRRHPAFVLEPFEGPLLLVEGLAQRCPVHRRHGITRPRPPSSLPAPQGAPPQAAPRSAAPSSRPCA